jgi:sulfur carrier protein
MQITVNGQPHELAIVTTITQLLADLGLDQQRIAIEVNKEVVSRSKHSEFQISDGDCVEIIQAVGGG